MKVLATAFLTLNLLILVACERRTVVMEVPPQAPAAEPVSRTTTIETERVGAAVNAFAGNPTAENLADAKKAFADLDGEIAELEAYVAKHTGSERAEAAAKLNNLTEYRAVETARLTAAQAKTPLTQPAPDARSGAEKVENSVRRAGSAIEDAAKNVGDAVKDVTR